MELWKSETGTGKRCPVALGQNQPAGNDKERWHPDTLSTHSVSIVQSEGSFDGSHVKSSAGRVCIARMGVGTKFIW